MEFEKEWPVAMRVNSEPLMIATFKFQLFSVAKFGLNNSRTEQSSK
jgi:hypothetical protein